MIPQNTNFCVLGPRRFFQHNNTIVRGFTKSKAFNIVYIIDIPIYSFLSGAYAPHNHQILPTPVLRIGAFPSRADQVVGTVVVSTARRACVEYAVEASASDSRNDRVP